VKYALYILFIVAVAYNTFPLALGLNRDHRNSHLTNLLLASVFGLLQGLMYHMGSLLGSNFMHLFVVRYKWVVFGIFVAVSVRMMLESLRIRRGERLFSFDNYVKFFIMAIAAGINTLIIGMTSSYFSPFNGMMPVLLIIAGFCWSIAGISMNMSRTNILLSSALHSAASVVIFTVAVVYLFTKNWF
jgi:putative Mn2+ efflux pump MntP